MLARILVPLDGSRLAERALEPAYSLARRHTASILLLCAIEPQKLFVPDSHMLGGYSTIWPDQSLELARKVAGTYLKTLQAKVPEALPADTAMVDGDPAEVIVDSARTETAGMIVMSSHGYSGMTRWVHGSVAERVLHDAACPVLIVRAAQPMRHMLITLDGSPLSEHVLAPAFAVAGSLGCKVTLLRATETLRRPQAEPLDPPQPRTSEHAPGDTHQDVEAYLTGIAAAHEVDAGESDTVVVHGGPVESILEYAQTHGVDLIAMSTHGRTGLKRWVYGSVTEKVLRAAHGCSMLVFRPAVHHRH